MGARWLKGRESRQIGRCYFPSLWTENSPVCHFCPSLWTDKSGQCRLFSVQRISFFLLLFAHKRKCPAKNPLNLTHKLLILQLNQATFDLPGNAIIRPTHKPSYRSSHQNSFFKFGEKNIVGVNNVHKISGFSRVRVRVQGQGQCYFSLYNNIAG